MLKKKPIEEIIDYLEALNKDDIFKDTLRAMVIDEHDQLSEKIEDLASTILYNIFLYNSIKQMEPPVKPDKYYSIYKSIVKNIKKITKATNMKIFEKYLPHEKQFDRNNLSK